MRTFRRFFSVYQNWLGVLILLDFGIVALLAPSLPPAIPPDTGLLPLPLQAIKNKLDQFPQPPSNNHPLGTLEHQEDILIDLINGSQQAISFSLKACLASALIGILIGAAGAYAGGFFNTITMRSSDVFLAVPVVILVVMLEQIQRVLFTKVSDVYINNIYQNVPQYHATLTRILTIDTTLWAIVFVGWIPYARIVNAMVMILKNTDFIQAARAMGASPRRIILRHLVPNAITPALVLLARDMGWVVILQASLVFAGFAEGSVWGGILVRSRNWIIGAGGNPFGYWWVWLPATVALIAYGIAWNLVGDGLNDALNPRV